MKKISELKVINITPEMLKEAQNDSTAFAKKMFNEDDCVNGMCTYVFHYAVDNSKNICIIDRAGNIVTYPIDSFESISDFTNGYCEVINKNHEKSLLVHSRLIPLDLKPTLDLIYTDPLEAQNVDEETLSEYWEDFLIVGTRSLYERLHAIHDDSRQSDISEAISGLLDFRTLMSENAKFRTMVQAFQNRFSTNDDEIVENDTQENWWQSTNKNKILSMLGNASYNMLRGDKNLIYNKLLELADESTLKTSLNILKKSGVSCVPIIMTHDEFYKQMNYVLAMYYNIMLYNTVYDIYIEDLANIKDPNLKLKIKNNLPSYADLISKFTERLSKLNISSTQDIKDLLPGIPMLFPFFLNQKNSLGYSAEDIVELLRKLIESQIESNLIHKYHQLIANDVSVLQSKIDDVLSAPETEVEKSLKKLK